MPGAITHLAIADRILHLLPEGAIKNEALFYAGVIAPDAIHARQGYKREYKKYTHLRQDIPTDEADKAENIKLFHERVNSFIDNYISNNVSKDLYLGYLIHILSDEQFVLTVRKGYTDSMRDRGIQTTDQQYPKYLLEDLRRIDCKIVREYIGMDKISTLLINIEPYEIKGFLSERELNISRDWVIIEYFQKEHIPIEPKYISYERVLEYINDTAIVILNSLSEMGIGIKG